MSKVAIVTGAAKGLGKAFSECLLKRGMQVCLSDVNVEAGQQTITELQEKYGAPQAMFMKCDTASKADMEEMFRKTKSAFGGLDLVVNNAGIMNEREVESMVQINLMGVIWGTLLGIEHMRKDTGGRGGQVVNIASSAGILPVPWAPAYSASKHGAVAYTTSWAIHPINKKTGVRYNCLCPTFADTDILKVTGDNTHGIELAKMTIEHFGIMSVDKVVAAFETLLDEEKNGAVVAVTSKGHKEVTYRTSPGDLDAAKL